MSEVYFPREIWYIIKSFEYAMTYSRQDQTQAIEYIKYHVSFPYILGLHDEKPVNKQCEALRTMRVELWHIFNDSTIEHLVEELGRKYHLSFGDVETYH